MEVSRIAEAPSLGLENGKLKIANEENPEVYRAQLLESRVQDSDGPSIKFTATEQESLQNHYLDFWILLKKCRAEAKGI